MMTDQNKCPRASVGAIVKKDDEYLVLYRKVMPTGLAFVAGHVDPGENPKDALVRELNEETGIVAESFKKILHDTFPNPCSKGFSSHEWFVYEIEEWSGEPKLTEPDKHKFVRFMIKEEVLKYFKRNEIDPAWGTYILPRLSEFKTS